MKCKKVLISLMLSMAMVFTALPAMAFAETAVAEDESKSWIDEISKQLEYAELIFETIGNASEDELRAASFMAVSMAKAKCQEYCAEAVDKITGIALGKIETNNAEIREFCQKMAGAIQALKTAYDNRLPKIKNYIKLAKSKVLQVKSLKKKSVSLKPYTLKKPKNAPAYKGKLTFSAKMLNNKSKKYLKFNKKTGKITVKKGAKKGTYKVRLTVRAKKDNNYKPCTVYKKVITIKVR